MEITVIKFKIYFTAEEIAVLSHLVSLSDFESPANKRTHTSLRKAVRKTVENLQIEVTEETRYYD
jgi:hypothetical protein